MRFAAVVAFTIISGLNSFSQQLFINEVSQGPSGTFEYVEFVVAGNATCQSPPPCLDMRGIIIDDNNGDFASGSGQGIATGAMRFANVPFWECIPQGTIIVVYNETARNTSIPPDDLSTSDGNCRLIIPANSNLLEKNLSAPTSSNSNYPATGWTSEGQWNTVAMANAQDSYQIRQNTSSASASHAVSWGGNNQNTIIYFSGSAGGLVYSMMNTTNNDPALQSNWQSASASSGQTPGEPNSAQNQTWIAAMNPICGSGNAITLDITSDPTGCGSNCTGSAIVNITGGTAPFTYLWSNGASTPTISNLCAQTYMVDVTDANGCTATEQVTISTESNTLSVSVSPANESCENACNGTVSVAVTGGTSPYTYLWSNGLTTQSISDLCAQTYTVEVTDVNNCTTTTQAAVGTDPNTLTASVNGTNESCANECDGTAVVSVSGGVAPYAYSWNNGGATSAIQNLCDGNYTVIVTDSDGCQATGTQTILPGAAGQVPVISQAGPFTTNDNPVQLTVSLSGGTWSANCTNCIDNNGIFNPQSAGEGAHQVCYTFGTGACAEVACITIIVTEGCATLYTSENISACPGEAIVYEGQNISITGSYNFNYQSINGCDSIHTVHFSIYNTNPLHDFIAICIGDSVEVNNSWYYEYFVANYETTDNNGCILQNTTTIIVNDCEIPEFNVFIPNTFTPNGDFVNDLFPITIVGGVLQSGFIINRWGQVVKEFSAADLTWDGLTQSGEYAPDGVYTYSVIVEKTGGVREQFHGFVTLIR